MQDCKLCTNYVTEKKLSKERKKQKKYRSQDKPYLVRKSAWISITGIHILMFIILFIHGTIILKSCVIIRQLVYVISKRYIYIYNVH